MKYPVQIMASAVDDFYRGVSLRAICRNIKQNTGSLPSISSVYEWVRKLTQIAKQEGDKYIPQVSADWIVSALSIWLNHKVYLNINILDLPTQFIIASRLGNFEDLIDIFGIARERTGQSPRRILTDGWRGYKEAIERVFGADTSHSIISFKQSREISAGYVSYLDHWRHLFKRKYKHLHGVDDNIQLIIEGIVMEYNYFCRQDNPGQQTPAEASKIDFPYQSWQDIAILLRENRIRKMDSCPKVK